MLLGDAKKTCDALYASVTHSITATDDNVTLRRTRMLNNLLHVVHAEYLIFLQLEISKFKVMIPLYNAF